MTSGSNAFQYADMRIEYLNGSSASMSLKILVRRVQRSKCTFARTLGVSDAGNGVYPCCSALVHPCSVPLEEIGQGLERS